MLLIGEQIIPQKVLIWIWFNQEMNSFFQAGNTTAKIWTGSKSMPDEKIK